MLFSDLFYNKRADYVFSNIFNSLVGRGETSGGRDLEAIISFGDNGLFVFIVHSHSLRLMDKDTLLLFRKRKLSTTSKLNIFFVSPYYIKKYLKPRTYRLSSSAVSEIPRASNLGNFTFFDRNNKSIQGRTADDWVKRLSNNNDFYRELPVTMKVLMRDNPEFSSKLGPFSDTTVLDNCVRSSIDLVSSSLFISKNNSLSSTVTGKDFNDFRSKLALSIYLKSSSFSHRFLFSNDSDLFFEASALRQEALANSFDSNFVKYVRDLLIRDIKNYNFKNKWNKSFKPLIVPTPINAGETPVKRFSRSKPRSSYGVPFMFNFDGSLRQQQRLFSSILKIKNHLRKSFEYTDNVYRNGGSFYSLGGPGDTFDLNLSGGLYETLRNYVIDMNYRVLPMSLFDLTASAFSKFLFFKKSKRHNLFKINKFFKALIKLKIRSWRCIRSARARAFKLEYYKSLKSSYILDESLRLNRVAVFALFNWRYGFISRRYVNLSVKLDSIVAFDKYTSQISLFGVYSPVFYKKIIYLDVSRSYTASLTYSKCMWSSYGSNYMNFEAPISGFSDLGVSSWADQVFDSFSAECAFLELSTVGGLESSSYSMTSCGSYTVEVPYLVHSIFDLYTNNGFFGNGTGNDSSNDQDSLWTHRYRVTGDVVKPTFGIKFDASSLLPTLSFLFNRNSDFLVRLQRRSVRSSSVLLWSHRLTLFSAALSGAYTRRHYSQYQLASKTLINILMLKCFSRHGRLFFNAPTWGWFGVSAVSPCVEQSVDISWVGSIKSPRKRLRSIKRRFAKRVVSKFGTRIAFSGVLGRASSPSTRGV